MGEYLGRIHIDMVALMEHDSYQYVCVKQSEDENGIYHIPSKWWGEWLRIGGIVISPLENQDARASAMVDRF